MVIVKKINFSAEEVEDLLVRLDGYIWVAVDVKKGLIAAGDEFAEKLKYELLKQKCAIEDIFGIGFDLEAGNIDYVSPINIKRLDSSSTHEVPDDKRDRVETLTNYFFSELPALKRRALAPRYSKKLL